MLIIASKGAAGVTGAGLATAPSPLIWSLVVARIGDHRGLAMCYLLQVGGAVLAIFATNPILLLVSAALLGGTFIGVVMMTIGVGTQMGISAAAAKLTTWYNLGQIAGPALVALALSETIIGSFIAAVVALALGMALTLYGALSGNVER